MARYVNTIPLSKIDVNFVANEIAKYMTTEGFKSVMHQGQRVWKKGTGWVTAPQYLAITFTPANVTVEAFIKFALLPGVYVGEMGVDGLFGAVPKALLKTRVQQVEQYLYTLLQSQQAYAAQAPAAPQA